jgi:hypothetical protein
MLDVEMCQRYSYFHLRLIWSFIFLLKGNKSLKIRGHKENVQKQKYKKERHVHTDCCHKPDTFHNTILEEPTITRFLVEITNNMHWFVQLLYSMYWLLHVSAVACHHQGASQMHSAGKHNRRNHETPAHRSRNHILYDIPSIRCVFQVTQKDLRSSLMMTGYCRNMLESVYRIKEWYKLVHSVCRF